VADLVRALLERAGYRVLVATDGEEALATFERHRDEIELVLSDVVMPRMGGPELVAALEERGHRPRVLYASGYTAEALLSRGFLEEGVDLLNKPYPPHELLRRVRGALDR
jgi:CheY-like chemotaxis protein